MDSELEAGYVDLQVNGYIGVDFNDPRTTPHDVRKAAEGMRQEGVIAALPTVITGPVDAMCKCLATLRQAIEQDELVGEMFRGIHIEGPFLSPEKGYIGAHPVECARAEDLQLLEKLFEAAGPWTRLVTLAPEIDKQGRLTALCAERGIVVAAGHTDATLEQLDCCIANGLELFTHLGNGCPKMMDRHDNIIYRALLRCDRLRYTLIADGFHLPEVIFRNLLDWIPLDRLAVVSDAISAAGLGPGTYQLGQRQISIGPDKAARDPSGQNFVGSACSMRDADQWLEKTLGLSHTARRQLLCQNPASWLHLS